jgi:hypothetical protein
LSLAAKDTKEKVFDAPPNIVYAAVQKVVRDHYAVTFADDKQMLVSFHTSNGWAGPYLGNVSVEVENGKGKLHITLQAMKNGNFGKAGRIEDDIIKWVEEELNKKY